MTVVPALEVRNISERAARKNNSGDDHGRVCFFVTRTNIISMSSITSTPFTLDPQRD